MSNDIEIINYRLLQKIRVIGVGYWFVDKEKLKTTKVSVETRFTNSGPWQKGTNYVPIIGTVSIYIVPKEESQEIEAEEYFHIACEYIVDLTSILKRYNISTDGTYDPNEPANEKITENVLSYANSLLRSNLHQTANSYISLFTSTHENSLKFFLPIYLLHEKYEEDKTSHEDTQE